MIVIDHLVGIKHDSVHLQAGYEMCNEMSDGDLKSELTDDYHSALNGFRAKCTNDYFHGLDG